MLNFMQVNYILHRFCTLQNCPLPAVGCDVPELSLGCQDLENLLLVSVNLIHSTAHMQAPNII